MTTLTEEMIEELKAAASEAVAEYSQASSNEERGRYALPAAMKVVRTVSDLLVRLADLERLREAVEAERACCKAEKIAMLRRSNFDISAMSSRIQAAEDKVDAALAKLTAPAGERSQKPI